MHFNPTRLHPAMSYIIYCSLLIFVVMCAEFIRKFASYRIGQLTEANSITNFNVDHPVMQ
jgi:hypothetical protein